MRSPRLLLVLSASALLSSILIAQPVEPLPLAPTRAQLIGNWSEQWVGDCGYREFRADGTCCWSRSENDTWSGRWWLDKDELTVYEYSRLFDYHIEWKCKLLHYSARKVRNISGGFIIRVQTTGSPIIITHHTRREAERDTKMPLVLTRHRPGL